MNIPIIFLLIALGLSAAIGFVIGAVWQSDKGPDREDWE